MNESLSGSLESEARPGEPGDGAAPLAPGVYLVATPIGNLADITLRALNVLRSVDLIACEDTRQSQKLLHHFGIRKPLVSYHLHNEQGRAEELLALLRDGQRVAVISDAGMPGIADPGAAIVQLAIEAEIPVFPVPGANAALSALVASGLNTERFTFHGFLPAKAGQRRSLLESLRGSLTANAGGEAATQIFYEAPHRILDALRDVSAVFGTACRVVVARELTKLHEEVLRGTAGSVLAKLEQRETVRGEIVLLLDGELTSLTAPTEAPPPLAEEVRTALREGLSEKEALKRVAKSRGIGKSEAFREWQRSKR